jgi:hypothetical protein
MEENLQGNIDRFKLSEIFQLIANGKKTGTLGIQRDDDIVMVYFKEGRIIYGYGPRQSVPVGQLLKEKGKVTADQLELAITEQTGKDVTKRLGQILIDLDFIDRADLSEAVTGQIYELIFSLMSWEKGSFKFYENQYPTKEDVTVDLSVENVILEGVRRIDEINRIKDIFPNHDARMELRATTAQRRDLSLNTEEWNTLALVDRSRTVGEIISDSKMPEVQTLEKLASLKLAGVIDFSRSTPARTDHLEVMVERLADLLDQYLNRRRPSEEEENITLETPGEN